MNKAVLKSKIAGSLEKLGKWVERHAYKGYEPFDGLSSALRPITFGNILLDRVLMQVVRQSPVNLRPALGIKPLDSTIGRGYMAWGYICLFQSTGDAAYRDKAVDCLQWLMDNKSPYTQEYSWGKHFDFASRGGRYPKFEPITVWTSLIGMAFLDGFEVLGDQVYLDVADSICRWILGLSRYDTDKGTCLSYTGTGDGGSTIHNHNLLAAAVLARTKKLVGRGDLLEVARRIVQFSCSCQLPDGSWYYGEEPKFHWIDNFHTGYNLDGVRCYIESTGEKTFEDNLRRGLQFYMKHFIEEDGRPRYYHNRTYPVDSQCIAQSIETLANNADIEPAALELSAKVAMWAIDHMQDDDGYFYYRQYPLITARTPMLHWAQATTYRALAVLFARLNGLRRGGSKTEVLW